VVVVVVVVVEVMMMMVMMMISITRHLKQPGRQQRLHHG
jgi:hypothetical protein